VYENRNSANALFTVINVAVLSLCLNFAEQYAEMEDVLLNKHHNGSKMYKGKGKVVPTLN